MTEIIYYTRDASQVPDAQVGLGFLGVRWGGHLLTRVVAAGISLGNGPAETWFSMVVDNPLFSVDGDSAKNYTMYFERGESFGFGDPNEIHDYDYDDEAEGPHDVEMDFTSHQPKLTLRRPAKFGELETYEFHLFRLEGLHDRKWIRIGAGHIDQNPQFLLTVWPIGVPEIIALAPGDIEDALTP